MIRPATIIELARIGFKPIPLDEDSTKPVIAWSPAYDRVGADLNELPKLYDKFHNAATCFGQTKVDVDGVVRVGWLNCLDIDSENVIQVLNQKRSWNDGTRSFVEKCAHNTWVTVTRKGMHIYWLTEDKLNPIHTEDCEPGWEFEIKTDKSGGLCHLPPSKHRKDSNYIYTNAGQKRIAFAEGIYDFLLKELGDFIKKKPKSVYIPKPQTKREPITLTDAQARKIAVIIRMHAYSAGLRHKAALALAGFLYKWGVVYESAELVFKYLAEMTEDEEKRERLATLKETYRYADKKPIVGLKLLREISPTASDRLVKIVSDIHRERANGMANKMGVIT